MPILNERGYLIPAINNDTVDYVDCARSLAHSIRQWHPTVKIALLTLSECNDPVFDHVITLPHGDQSKTNNKQINDWQCFEASPFRQTIKLEADMVLSSPFDHWWTMFEHCDIVVSQGCRDFYNQPAASRSYRRVFDANNLPDVYNAVTYWRLSKTAQQFFQLVRNIFENWTQWRTLLRFPDDEASTDLVYAMAVEILGREVCTIPGSPNIVHMKQHIIGTHTSNWTRELVWEDNNPGLRLNTVAQWGLVHYHIKDWISNESRNNR